MLRRRKYKRYNEETNEDEGGRRFDIKEQIRSKRFDQDKLRHLQELSGDEITLKLIQKHGFEKPILVKEPHGLDLRVPPKSFLVRDVRNCVGPERIIDVMDVGTQKNIEMSMKDWCKYYESKHRDKLLNVISLEFSHTKLDELVEAPKIVKLLDWVDLVWPKFLKERQTESTNSIHQMMYPKVQKYCLMSVKGSYTDFHIDFGGTSVWYHMIRGRKIFWMVPPTELNLQTFEEWTLSGMQQDVFFGDTVEECFRIELSEGNTFFIPSGWIHAVYTLEDSLVFGGNFLHSFAIENQLKVSKIEDATRVPVKFRYPFYTEILWYVVQHYVFCLTGKDHLHRPAVVEQSSPEMLQPSVGKKSCIQNDDDNVETDATTESEYIESDTKKSNAQAAKRKKGKTTKTPKKRPKKVISDDDESTEIDSASEMDTRQEEKKSTNTCRMTKNSLSRLQYEIEERDPLEHRRQISNVSSGVPKQQIKNETTSSSANTDSATKKKLGDQLNKPIKEEHAAQRLPDHNSNSLGASNLSEIISDSATTTTMINGWSLNGNLGGQTTWSNQDSEPKETKGVHLTKLELHGLKFLIKHLSKLSGAKKNLPALIKNSRALLDDCRKLVVEHESDDQELAITGSPITPELLHPKKSNINELIEQFFKQAESNTSVNSSINHSPTLIKSDSMTLTQQQRLKLNQCNDDKVISNSNNIASNSHAATSIPKTSPQKEMKCLSPVKKLSIGTTQPFLSATPVSTSPSTPPRPKSPPTRPLSNNQYTSRTTKVENNNLLLPGSFADLIAATSTEKKVFDVNSSEITSSLFGANQSITPRTSSGSPTKSNPTKEKERPMKSTIVNKISPANRDISHSGTNTTTATTTTTTMTAEGVKLAPSNQKPPNSPEPPKASPQKRFINPTFKPQVKEKLIFASAPYVSPVHASDQSRNTNLYPWQSPAIQPPPPHHLHHQKPHPQHHQYLNKPTAQNIDSGSAASVTQTQQYNPSIQQRDPQSQPTNFSSSSSVIQKADTPPIITNPKPTPSIPATEQSKLAPSSANPRSLGMPSSSSKEIPLASETMRGDEHRNAGSTRDELRVEKHAPISLKVTKVDEKHKKANQAQLIEPINATIARSVIIAPPKPQPPAVVEELSIKKPTKPRGPPKKSKEARQDYDLLSQASSSFAPTPVIVTNNTQPSVTEPVLAKPVCTPSPVATPTATITSSNASTKPKSRSTKKSKSTANSSTANPVMMFTSGAQSNPTTTNGPRPPMICGLVSPPISSSSAVGSKINPQQYLISRPLLFNGVPAFSSAAQMQQMTRSPLPIFTAPMPSLGLPTNMHQNARIVWATQPRRPDLAAGSTQTKTNASSNPALTTNTTPAAPRYGVITAPRLPPMPSTAIQPDNAALLSLATTALSTAPMPSSPALSHLGARSQPNQSIMVSSAGGQTGFLPGQQMFSPYMQRLPMAQFPTAAHSGPAQRSTGQLVFAKLPHTIQGQPRYLLTQPGSFIHHQQQLGTQLVAGQPRSTMAFAAYKPTPPLPINTDPTKSMKSKKVKTN